MFYIESNDPAVLGRKDEAIWVLNRLVEGGITSLPDDFLEYHRRTRSPYHGSRGPIVEAEEYTSLDECGNALYRALVKEDRS